MHVYNQRPHRSLSNLSILEIQHGDNALDIFPKRSSFGNESEIKNKFSDCDTVRINRTNTIFKKGNYLWSTELFKVSKVLETKLVTYRLRDCKDDEILGGFYDYDL